MKDNLVQIKDIQNKIFFIRDLQVMLDKDLADIYGVKPIRLREQVKRNINRFPEDFMFRLSDSEVDILLSQNAIPSKKQLGGYNPLVFTEQGVSMLSAVLKTPFAIEVSVKIIRAFVEMKKFITANAGIFQRLDKVEQKLLLHDKSFEKLFKALEDKTLKPNQGVFFNGQVFDAYTFVSDLIRSAKKSIILIDNYIDDTVLTHFTKRKKGVKTVIFTKNVSKQLQLDIKKHNAQYEPIEIKIFKDAHDRFLIIDEKEVYHFGASLKDLGKKIFAFSKMDASSVTILNSISEML